MGDETVVKDQPEKTEIDGKKIIGSITLSNGKEYKMVDVRYKHIKKCSKVAGGKRELLNDLLIQEFFPEMTQDLIDDLRPRDLKSIAESIAVETGMDINKVQDF